MSYQNVLFIFRRDLRLQDNTALIKACALAKKVIPCFILDPRQLSNQNKFKSDSAISFMAESLLNLHTELKNHDGKLYLFEGQAESVVEKLITNNPIEAVFINRDYTPFSRNRDRAIQNICTSLGVKYYECDDVLLTNPDQVITKQNGFYRVFSPFYKAASALPVETPNLFKATNFYTQHLPDQLTLAALEKFIKKATNNQLDSINTIIKNLKYFDQYHTERDFPATPTTRLSAHLKFGTISIRTIFYAIVNQLGINSPLLRQLYWRDFWTYIAYHWPHVFGHSFNQEYDQLPWHHDQKKFDRWCAGTTGFPIVDAGMRELNTTGFMHGRARMIVASFLTKDLHLDWRHGEQYFAQKLTDYDPALNNGNWQWCASTGCDAQPYFRIFNPWLQQKKFDPACLYIKKWIPELETFPPATIHHWHIMHKKQHSNYPTPMLNHATESTKAKKMYAQIK